MFRTTHHYIKEKQEQNKLWLENRPLWQADKANPELCKHPKRWLAHCNTPHSTPRMGWLDMSYMRRGLEIQNSQRNRRAKRK